MSEPGGIDPRVFEAFDHLQKAALEMISAMRNALDVAEDLVGDPSALAGALTLLQNGFSTVTANVYRDRDPHYPETNVSRDSGKAENGTGATSEHVQRINVD